MPSSNINLEEDPSFFLDALHEDFPDAVYLSPQDWESLTQRLQNAPFLLPKPGTKTSEPGTPSSSTDRPEVDPHEDLRKYIPNNPDVDLSLPVKQITRIMKKAVPPDALISDAAKFDMGRCVVEFIQFLTSEAAENALKTRRRTIEGGDIIEAMDATGFENYAEALRPYLDAYREEKRKADAEKRNKGNAASVPSSSRRAEERAASPDDEEEDEEEGEDEP